MTCAKRESARAATEGRHRAPANPSGGGEEGCGGREKRDRDYKKFTLKIVEHASPG